jgi:hypothetical protein
MWTRGFLRAANRISCVYVTFRETNMATAALPLPAQQWLRRHWLSVVMLTAYLLLSLLIIEQGRTIDAQRTLIRKLFSDSLQLNALKVEKQQAQQLRQSAPEQQAPAAQRDPHPTHSAQPELRK